MKSASKKLYAVIFAEAIIIAMLSFFVIRNIVVGASSADANPKDSVTADMGRKNPDDPAAPDIPDDGYVTLSIDNGAAKANTNYAVNGLHVYDPTSKDLDDFVDKAKVPKGTKISIYVYNLASDVHLNVKHDGKVIKDKTYPILQSDNDVEFIDLVLEGDLVVKTEASHYEPSTTRRRPTEAVQSLEVENGCQISINNTTGQSLDIRYLDEDNNVFDVVNGSRYPEGLTIFSRVTNTSSEALRLTAVMNGVTVGTANIGPKPAGDIATYFGLDAIELKGDLTFYLTFAKDGDISNVTPTPSPTPAITEESDVPVFTTISEAAAYVEKELIAHNETIVFDYKGITTAGVRDISRAVMAEAVSYKGIGNKGDYVRFANRGYDVLAGNGKASNSARVTFKMKGYNDTVAQEKELDAKLAEIESGLEVSHKSDYEKALAVYKWICNNVTYDYEHLNKTYPLKDTAYAAAVTGTAQCQGYAQLLYRLLNDLGVECRIIAGDYDGGGHAWNIVKIDGRWFVTDPTHGAQVSDDVNTITNAKNNTYYFLKGSKNVVENTPYSEYTSGDFAKDYPISETDYVLGGATEATVTIVDGGKAGNTDTAVNGLHVYDPKSATLDDLTNGAKVGIGSKLSVYDYNYSTPVHITIVNNGKTIVDVDQKLTTSDRNVIFYDFTVEGDVTITTSVIDESAFVPKLHINDDSLAWVYDAETYQDLHEGATLDEGEKSFEIYSNAKDIHMVVKVGSTVVEEKDIAANKSVSLTVNVKADVYFEFTEKNAAAGTNYTVTIENRVSDAVLNVSWVDMSAGAPASKVIASGDKVAADTGVYVQVMNPTAKRLKVSVYVNDTLVASETIDSKPDDEDFAAGGIMGDDFTGIHLTGNMKIVLSEE